jgi:hypothetical protein
MVVNAFPSEPSLVLGDASEREEKTEEEYRR